MTRRLGVTRRGALGLIFGASSLIFAAGTALASSSAVATPGESVTIKTNKGSRYTWVKFINRGPGAAEIEIASPNVNETFVIADGGTVEMTKSFGTRSTRITNNSTTATVRIDSRWL